LFALKRRITLLLKMALVTAVAVGIYWYITKDDKVTKLSLFGLLLAPALVLPDAVTFFFVAKKEFGAWAVYRIAQGLLVPIGGAVAAVTTGNIYVFAAAQWIIPGILGGTTLIFLSARRGLRRSYANKEIDPACLDFGIKMIPADLVSMTAYRMSHLAMGHMPQSLAVYSISAKLREKSAQMMRYPKQLFFADFANMELTELLRKIWSLMGLTIVVGFLAAGAFAGLGYLYISRFLGPEYQFAWKYFAVLACGLPAVLSSIVIHTAFEAQLRAKEISITMFVADFFKIVAIAVAVYMESIMAIAVVEVATNWLRTSAFIVLLRRNLGKQ
jgi:O-antigen/teichoic acid export membrane protein